ncbi:MAG: amidohydrolase family protein [Phycisphaerae bacterium]|nr:amidohydrolase family protein [Phycisphaerae bacterium]
MTIYRARCIAPVATPPIDDGCIAVDGTRITAVGPTADIRDHRPSGTPLIDLGDVIVTPGFINAHAHLELTAYRDMIPAEPLWTWIEKLIELRRRPHAARLEQEGIGAGIDESIAAGVTCIGDISRTGAATAALAASPIRAVAFIELISGAREEPCDCASLIRAVETAKKMHQSDRLRVGVSPHAPYTVTPIDMMHTLEFAAEQQMPATIHCLETRDEADWLAGRPSGIQAFLSGVGSPNAQSDAAMQASGALWGPAFEAARPLLAHVNYPTSDDMSRIANVGASVVFCPRAHRFYGHTNHPWRKLFSAGINVCIGTDSAACVPTLSIRDELATLSGTDPDDLLRMATINGAQALRWSDEIGTIEPGKRADFVAIDLAEMPGDEPITAVANPNCRVTAVAIGGKLISQEFR